MNSIRAVVRPIMENAGFDPPVSLLIFLSALLITLYITPRVIKKLTHEHHLVKDHYKHGDVRIPSGGGIAIMGGLLGSLILTILYFPDVADLLLFYFIVISYGMFGVGDDMLDISRKSKVFLPILLGLPIALLAKDSSIWLIFGRVDFGLMYLYLLAPLYILVVANLINMHSGYNGLCTGLSAIILGFIALKSYMAYGVDSLFYVMPILGTAVGFWYFDHYPSKILMGNSGSMIFGSAIGGLIILNNFELFGVIILIPHIINFLLFVYWKIAGVPFQKFGSIRADGTVIAPNPLTLKWIPAYYFRVTEHQATLIMYELTMFFGVIALAVTSII